MTEDQVRPAGQRIDHTTHRRRWLVWTLVGVAVFVAVVVGGPWLYAQVFAPEPTEPLALATPEVVPTPTPTPVGPLEVDGTWQVAEGSEAGYRLGEILSGQQVTVVGRTQEVSGTATISDGVLSDARIVVDVASIATDESARDAYFRRALDVSTFPDATFELTEPVDVSAVAEGDDPVAVDAVGTLTMHGVSRPVTATLEVQRSADGVELVGQLPVTLADFGLSAPDLGFVTVEPTGTVEMLLQLTR